MPGALSPLERLIIVTARKYLSDNAKIWEKDSIPTKLPLSAQDPLIVEGHPWSEYWLYGKISNEYRLLNKTPPDFSSFQKTLLKLKEKQYLKIDGTDRLHLMVESTRFVK